MTTAIGFTVTCQDCGTDYESTQTARSLQGVGEAGMTRCTYSGCPSCEPDISATSIPG
jgi:hypothetical protein